MKKKTVYVAIYILKSLSEYFIILLVTELHPFYLHSFRGSPWHLHPYTVAESYACNGDTHTHVFQWPYHLTTGERRRTRNTVDLPQLSCIVCSDSYGSRTQVKLTITVCREIKDAILPTRFAMSHVSRAKNASRACPSFLSFSFATSVSLLLSLLILATYCVYQNDRCKNVLIIYLYTICKIYLLAKFVKKKKKLYTADSRTAIKLQFSEMVFKL